MIDQQDGAVVIQGGGQGGEALAMCVPSVIPSDDLQAIGQPHNGITEQDNGCLGDEPLHLPYATYEIMIPRYEVGAQRSEYD